MGDGHSFYPDLALLNEVYNNIAAQEQTKWAENKVAEELNHWGCSQYEDYLNEAREWEDSEMHNREKERLTKLVNSIHQLLTPYVDKDIWEEWLWDDGDAKSVRDVYSLNLDLDWDETHYLASMELNLKNYGEFGPPSTGKTKYDTLGGELVREMGEYMEYDELLLALERLLRAIDDYLLI